MRNRALFSFVLFFSALLFSSMSAFGNQSSEVRVAFISPDTSTFWSMVGGFMQVVAKDLEIDLTIYTDHETNRFSYRDLLEDVLAQREQPDFIILMCREKVTHEMLKMIDGAEPRVLVGLSGGHDSSASIDRNLGLRDMLEAHPGLKH